jgi:hypothetical protein
LTRKILASIVLLAALIAPAQSPAAEGVVGDINADGQIDLVEVMYALKVSVGIQTPEPKDCPDISIECNGDNRTPVFISVDNGGNFSFGGVILPSGEHCLRCDWGLKIRAPSDDLVIWDIAFLYGEEMLPKDGKWVGGAPYDGVNHPPAYPWGGLGYEFFGFLVDCQPEDAQLTGVVVIYVSRLEARRMMLDTGR